MHFRAEQLHLMTQQGLSLGEVTTVNLTMLKGGVQHNVVPEVAQAGFDIRISPILGLKAFSRILNEWTTEEGVSFSFVNGCGDDKETAQNVVDKNNDPWWSVLKITLEEVNVQYAAEIFPGATDSRFIRLAGIPAYGISPIRLTDVLLHDNNEYLNEKIFIEGITFYYKLITNINKPL